MKRDQWTISDVTGDTAEKLLNDYNLKLLCPQRSYGTSATNYTLPPTKEKKRKKNDK
jgi:hypothetical protein